MQAKDKKNISKKDIIENIKFSVGTSHQNIHNISDSIIDIIIEILIKNKKVNIKNFGSFNIIYKKSREGRNPRTKEKFEISSRKAISFKVSSFIKERVN